MGKMNFMKSFGDAARETSHFFSLSKQIVFVQSSGSFLYAEFCHDIINRVVIYGSKYCGIR